MDDLAPRRNLHVADRCLNHENLDGMILHVEKRIVILWTHGFTWVARFKETHKSNQTLGFSSRIPPLRPIIASWTSFRHETDYLVCFNPCCLCRSFSGMLFKRSPCQCARLSLTLSKVPENAVDTQNQRRTAPDWRRTAPDWRRTAPDWRRTAPDWRRTAPDWRRTAPDWRRTAPDWRRTAPDWRREDNVTSRSEAEGENWFKLGREACLGRFVYNCPFSTRRLLTSLCISVSYFALFVPFLCRTSPSYLFLYHYWTHGFTMRHPVEVLYTISVILRRAPFTYPIQLVFILWTGTHVVMQLRTPEMLSLS